MAFGQDRWITGMGDISSKNTIEIVQKGDKFQLIDGKRKISKPLDSIGVYNRNDFFIVKNNGLYGMYSPEGIEVIPIRFEKIKRLFNQFWIVKTKDKYGVYNIYKTNDNEILKPIYDKIDFSRKYGAEFIVKKKEKLGLFSSKGMSVTPIIYDSITFHEALLKLKKDKDIEYYIPQRIEKRELIPEKIFKIYGTYISDTKYYYPYKVKGKIGVLNKDGSILISPKYKDLAFANYPEKILLAKKENQWGIITLNEDIILPFEYDSIKIFSPNFLIVEKDTHKYFYHIKKHHLITDYSFDRANLNSGYSFLYKDNYETMVDNRTGELKFPFQYQSIDFYKKQNLYKVKENNLWGLIDENQKEIIPPVYEELNLFCTDKIVVKKGGKYGVIDYKQNILLPFEKVGGILVYDDYIQVYSGDYPKYNCELKLIDE